MKSRDEQYQELFLIEAKDNIEELDRLFVELEKDHGSSTAIKDIFRVTHTMKGNAMGLGLDSIAQLSHVMEDVMLAIQEGRVGLDGKLFQLLFRANDKLGGLINALETGEKVSFLGIKTSLSLHLQKALEEGEKEGEEDQPSVVADTPTPEDQEPEEQEDSSATHISFSEVIQIPVKRMDDLMNEVGQLIIERDRLIAVSEGLGLKSSELDRLKRITSNLQYTIMNVRMVQVGFLFNKFHRVLRDAARIEGKDVNLILKGTDVEIDRNVLKVLSDSLVHLVRNSVSHGIEGQEVRKTRNKPAQGTVMLNARYERDRVVIMVTDDGGGIDAAVIRKKVVEKGLVSEKAAKNLRDEEIIQYIFAAGFSNTDKVNELSGRGVGMDVVKRAVESIGGQVKVDTIVGEGTTINLHVPASLALKGTLLFEVSGFQYALALSYAESVESIKPENLYTVGSVMMTKYHDQTISVVFLSDLLNAPDLKSVGKVLSSRTTESLSGIQELETIVVSYAGRMTGLVVDHVLQQKEIIEKPLSKPINAIRLLSGTTILGNGAVCPVIDVAAITEIIHSHTIHAQHEAS